MENDKIIRDETSQEMTVVLQVKHDRDLNQNGREMDDVYFCNIESKCLRLGRLDAWKRKRCQRYRSADLYGGFVEAVY